MPTLTVHELVSNALAGAGYAPKRRVYQSSRWFKELARESQIPPEGDWSIWLLLAGRGFGKTRTICEFAIEKARMYPGSRGAIVGAVASDVRNVLMLGDSGIMNISEPDFMPEYNPSNLTVEWPNGSKALLFSADEPRRLRGPQQHWAIADELAAWRRTEAWDMLLMGTRLGDNPQIAIATTPRPIKLIKDLIIDPSCHVTRGSTYDNKANLAKQWFDKIINRYEGTRLGRQELEAVILDDVPGALWSREMIDSSRVAEAPELKRVVVAIDPAVTANAGSDETGIIVAGLGTNDHAYILDDMTVTTSPVGWGTQAIAGYNKYNADRMIAEVNNGGDMIEHTIRSIRDATDTPIGRNVSFKQVRASRGKYTRAEPIAALYEQGRVHHVGIFPELEDQLCQWTPGESSPDRLDAMVWALTELMISGDSYAVGALDEW